MANLEALKMERDLAQERQNIYWNNYTRKLVGYGMGSPEAVQARALYIGAVSAYYKLARRLRQEQEK